MFDKSCKFKKTCSEYKPDHLTCKKYQNVCSIYPYLKAGYKNELMKCPYSSPKLLEYDQNNDIVDVFVRKDLHCPFPFNQDDWYHQGFYLNDFIGRLKTLFRENNLPYFVQKKREKK